MKLFVLCLSLLATQCASAQEAGAPPMPPPQPMPVSGPMRHDLLFIAGAELDRGRVVQNAPYCADALHETVRTLADGNRIVHRQSSRQCRDGQGRTRQEVGAGTSRHVFLHDPVGQQSWMLDPEKKTATRLDSPRRPPPPEGADGGKPGWEERLRDWSREMRGWGREMGDWARERFRQPMEGKGPSASPGPQAPHPPMPDMPAMPPVPVRIVIGGPQGGPPPLPPGALPPAVAFHARMGAPRGPGTVTALAPETVEGLKAEGKRTTWTIEAGRIGNEKPILITREVWTSPELRVTLRSRETDPLAGEDSYRLQNLVRGEPDAALLQVPDDYRKITTGASRKP